MSKNKMKNNKNEAESGACLNCVYWRPEDHLLAVRQDYGKCYVDPPRIFFGRPQTKSYDTCGKFRSNEKTRKRRVKLTFLCTNRGRTIEE